MAVAVDEAAVAAAVAAVVAVVVAVVVAAAVVAAVLLLLEPVPVLSMLAIDEEVDPRFQGSY